MPRAAGRTSRLNDIEFAREVADLYVRGVSYQEMADALDCGVASIRNWVKDPRVQAHARREAIQRVHRITRRIDGEIDMRLARVEEWHLEELLKVRKEFLDRPLKVLDGEGGLDAGQVANELSEAIDQDAEFATAFRELVAASKK